MFFIVLQILRPSFRICQQSLPTWLSTSLHSLPITIAITIGSMTQLPCDQSLLRPLQSSDNCPPAPLCVSTVGRDFNRDPAHYAQQTRDETEDVYWRYNRIGAKSGTKTNLISPDQPTPGTPEPRASISWPSSPHHRIPVPHHYRRGDDNDSYVSPCHPDHEFDQDPAMRLSRYGYVKEVGDEDQWDM